MKRSIFISIICVICAMLMITPAEAVSNLAQNWYCARNKEHKQPNIDANMRFIENYEGYYVDKKYSDDCEEKVVYLTFDAGYENGNVSKILDILREEEVIGAFFILGNLIKRNTDLVIRMADEGHIVANHTFSHKDMTKVDDIESFKAELDSLNDIYKSTTGREMSKYYRPPEGRFDERSLSFASSLGYKTIFWSIAYADWDNNAQPSIESAKEKILGNIHNGAVILLHPTSATNVLILKDIIVSLKQEGYRFGSLDELVATD